MLDDLELDNVAQPHAVVQVVRRVAQRHLLRLDARAQARTRTALRDRVSFHLAVPMIESWLFADPRGPANAGAPPDRVPLLREVDPEDFETDDSAYAMATDQACTRWQSLPDRRKKQRRAKNKLRPVWAGRHDRTRHPKGYLCWLCMDAGTKSCTTYEESKGGARALTSLDWKRVLGRSRMPFLRSLVADLADALGQAPSIGPIDDHQATLTCRSRAPTDAVLRNL